MDWLLSLPTVQQFFLLGTAISVLLFLILWLLQFVRGFRASQPPRATGTLLSYSSFFAMAFPLAFLAVLQDWHLSLCILIPPLAGALAFLCVQFGQIAMWRTLHHTPILPKELIGKTATVWVPIPPNEVGRVQLTVNEQFLEVDARAADGFPRDMGQQVTLLAFDEDLIFTVK